MAMQARLIVTCEHGGNRIPGRWASLFRGREAELASHRGHDIGAAAVARKLSRALAAPLHVAWTSRLLVDLNRSPGHPALFSEVTRALAPAEKGRILGQYYLPHRRAVEQRIERERAKGQRVLHLAVHSFTPMLGRAVRRADVGLLYDPRRAPERRLCARWQEVLHRVSPLSVRRNYPYRGASDGLATALRRAHPASGYLGVEIELNQRLLVTDAGVDAVVRALLASLRQILRAG
jgi:predicted N-formylglutamate amidohydrolase